MMYWSVTTPYQIQIIETMDITKPKKCIAKQYVIDAMQVENTAMRDYVVTMADTTASMTDDDAAMKEKMMQRKT